MAAAKKLQDEIHRCLKEVTKGVEMFDDILKRFHDPENSSKKETYYENIAKRIKKLQKLRDQITTWISSTKIKDVEDLLHHRNIINDRMKRFSEIRRVMTTKDYSNEALSSVPKLDPVEKEKEDTCLWLNQSIKTLNFQIDQCEHQMQLPPVKENILLIKDTQRLRDELRSRILRHRQHIQKLETLLRMLNNMAIKPKKILSIKGNVDYYIGSSHKKNFKQTDHFYDDLIRSAESKKIQKRHRDRCK